MRTQGVVREWQAEDGWGVIDSPATPGGCWAHFSSVLVPGYRTLTSGQEVELDYESVEQDGYRFRAVGVWPRGREPEAATVVPPTSTAYESTLTLTFDEPDQSERRGRQRTSGGGAGSDPPLVSSSVLA